MRIEPWRLYQALSLLAAITLSAWPLPDPHAAWQPQWVVMTMIYWMIAKPGKVGFGMAWATGLLSDLIAGNWIGIHVLSYCVIVFLCVRFFRVLQLPNTLQRLVPVGLLLMFHIGYIHLSSTLLSNVSPSLLQWASLPTSLLVWPALHYLLRKIPTGEPQER